MLEYLSLDGDLKNHYFLLIVYFQNIKNYEKKEEIDRRKKGKKGWKSRKKARKK